MSEAQLLIHSFIKDLLSSYYVLSSGNANTETSRYSWCYDRALTNKKYIFLIQISHQYLKSKFKIKQNLRSQCNKTITSVSKIKKLFFHISQKRIYETQRVSIFRHLVQDSLGYFFGAVCLPSTSVFTSHASCGGNFLIEISQRVPKPSNLGSK